MEVGTIDRDGARNADSYLLLFKVYEACGQSISTKQFQQSIIEYVGTSRTLFNAMNTFHLCLS